MGNNGNNLGEITISTLAKVLKRNIIWILLGAIVLGCCAAVFGIFVVGDVYTSSITYMIGDGSTTNTDLNAMDEWVVRYRALLTSKSVIKKIVENSTIDDADLDFAVTQMAEATSFSGKDAGVFTITVTYSDPSVAYAMITSYKDMMNQIIDESNLPFEVMYVDGSTAPASAPSNGGRAITYGVFGFVMGAVLVFGIALLIKVNDTKIHTEMDVKEILDLPVVGTIPRIVPSANANNNSLKLEN